MITASRPVATLVDDLAVDGAVAEGQLVADLDVAEQIVVADLDHVLGGLVVAGQQPDRRPRREVQRLLAEAGGPHLGTGQVDQGADVTAGVGGKLAHPVVQGERILEGAVGEVEAHGIHARLHHLLENGVGLARGADRREDLCSSLHRASMAPPAALSGDTA